MPNFDNIMKLLSNNSAGQKKNANTYKLMRQLSTEIHSAQGKLNAITAKRKGKPASPTSDEKTIMSVIRDKIKQHTKLSKQLK